MSIDSSDVALPKDTESFNKVTQETPILGRGPVILVSQGMFGALQDGNTLYLANGQASWLTPDLLEHWKAWC